MDVGWRPSTAPTTTTTSIAAAVNTATTTGATTSCGSIGAINRDSSSSSSSSRSDDDKSFYFVWGSERSGFRQIYLYYYDSMTNKAICVSGDTPIGGGGAFVVER